MAGKQAKLLQNKQITLALTRLRSGRAPQRDQAMLLLSVKAGLRAGEIAALTWPMVLLPDGQVGEVIELHDIAAKKGSGRTIPLNPDLRHALAKLHKASGKPTTGPVIRSQRGGRLRASSVVNWFRCLYGELGFTGCSSHSGRRTFITMAARLVHRAQGSLRDVQQLAGHRSVETTQRYIEGDSEAKRRLVCLL